MGLCVLAFSIMFNHIHSLFKDISKQELSKFQLRLLTNFTQEYNAEYGRSGPIFRHPYGKAVKKTAKNIISCVAYVFNNPVAGRMCRKAAESRWTMLAYYRNPNPFSEKLVKRNSRHAMRDALKIVDIYHAEGKWLGYAVLRRIYGRLDAGEKRQMTDYIISKYIFLQYDSLEILFGSLDKTLKTVDSIAGNEYELEDEFGDHSNYQKMIAHSRILGFEGPDFEKLSDGEIRRLSRALYSKVNPSSDQMRKFLHLSVPSKALQNSKIAKQGC